LFRHYHLHLFSLLNLPPPSSPLFPYTTLFRSKRTSDFFPADIAKSLLDDDVLILRSGKTMLNRERMLTDADGREHWTLTSKMPRSEEHTSELQSRFDLVCRLLLEKKKVKCNES